MKKSTFSEEQIAYALRQADGGTPVGHGCRQLGVSEATFYVWKKKYGQFGVSEMREMRQHLHESAKPSPAGTGPLLLTRLQLLDHRAALVPPPRINRHRRFAVLVRTAAQGKFPQRRRTTGAGRYGKLSIKQRIFSSAARRTMFDGGHRGRPPRR